MMNIKHKKMLEKMVEESNKRIAEMIKPNPKVSKWFKEKLGINE